jgi:hypothetical protein
MRKGKEIHVKVPRLVAGLALSLAPVSTALAQAHPQALSATEVRRTIVGADVTHQSEMGPWTFIYGPNGRYDSTNGRVADGGTYAVQADGRICWTRRLIDSRGCFQYYRLNGKLRVRADNGDIGPVEISRRR